MRFPRFGTARDASAPNPGPAAITVAGVVPRRAVLWKWQELICPRCGKHPVAMDPPDDPTAPAPELSLRCKGDCGPIPIEEFKTQTALKHERLRDLSEHPEFAQALAGIVVCSAHLEAETNETPCASNSSTSLAKSASDRVSRSTL